MRAPSSLRRRRSVASELRAAYLASLVGFVVLAGAGCGSCGAPSGGLEAGAVSLTPEPPVPAPAGLLAEVWIHGPDSAWSQIQRGVSGAVALLPPTVGELACAFAALDAPLAQLIDGGGMSYAVLGDGGAGEGAAWVVAFPLTDAALASSMLLGSGGPADAAGRYSAHDVGGMRALSSADHPPSATIALARGAGPRGWLALASSEEALAHLGPYAVRTMPTKTAPAESAAIVADLPPSALAGALSSWLGARWGQARAWLSARDDEQRAKHGGRAPDFGDPRPIVDALDGAVTRRIGLLAGARGARIVVDAGDDEVHVELALTPGSDAASESALAAMTPGDTHPLAETPADAVVALLVRDEPTSRGEDAAAIEATLEKALGDRFHEDDARALHAAIADWFRTRGNWWTGALAWGPTDASRGIWLRTPAASADESSRAVRELVDLSRRRPLQDLLAGSFHVSPAAVRTVDAAPFGKVSIATFVDAAPGNRKPDGVLGLAWGVREGELLLAAGTASTQLLSAGAIPARKVGDDSRGARALLALGQSASFAVIAQPLRLSATRGEGEASAPAVFAWGRRGTGAWARLELADSILRELLRWKSGL